jgi:renalase
MSGLACAASLIESGLDPVVFDRGRVVGGRISRKQVESSLDESYSVDHGAPYMQVSGHNFSSVVHQWIRNGVCVGWNPRIGELRDGEVHFVSSYSDLVIATPSMSCLPSHLAQGVHVRVSSNVQRIQREGETWRVQYKQFNDQSEHVESFDWVLIAAPAEQSLRLVTQINPAPDLMIHELRKIKSTTVWIGILLMEAPLVDLPDVLRLIDHEVIDQIIMDHQKPDEKPDRASDELKSGNSARLVIHARSEWSFQQRESDPRQVQLMLSESVRGVLSEIGVSQDDVARMPESMVVHRWGLAQPKQPLSHKCIIDQGLKIGLCGDWMMDHSGWGGVERAWESGTALAQRVVDEHRIQEL